MSTDRLQIWVDPEPGSQETSAYTITVRCEHGATRTTWRRTCGNGCHGGSAGRRSLCQRVTPPAELLRGAGVATHGKLLRCGCDEAYWLASGPLHELPAAPRGTEFHVREGPLTADEFALLRATWRPENRREPA